MKQRFSFRFLFYRAALLGLFTVFAAGALVSAGKHEKAILEHYLPLISSQDVDIDTAKEIREAIFSMDEGEELQLIRQALCCDVIRTVCETESSSERELAANDYLNTLKILQGPGLYAGGLIPEMWDKVFSYLCPEERADAASVCRVFYDLSQPHGPTENAGGLPNETWYHVLSYLPTCDLPTANRTCRALRDLAAYKRDALVHELCDRKDKKGILDLMNTNVLSPKHLNKVWNTFIEPINPQRLEYGGHFSEELNSFYGAFCKQLFRIMENKYVLNNHFKWVIKVIKRIKTKDDQFALLKKLAETYEGDEGDLLLDAMDELFQSNEGIRATFMPHLAKNSKFVRKNLERVLQLSQNSAQTSTTLGVKGHIAALAKYYSGDAKDLMGYAENRLRQAMDYYHLSLHIGPCSIYVGLLENEKLSRECYKPIVLNVSQFRAGDLVCPLLCALCQAYTGDHYQLLEKTILAILKSRRTRTAEIANSVNKALKQRASQLGSQGDDQGKKQLRALADRVLELAKDAS